MRAHLQDLKAGDAPPSTDFKYKLVWKRQPVPFEDAVAYYVDKNNATNTAGRIDVMIDSYLDAMANGDISDDCVMGVRKDDTISRPISISAGSLTIVGEGVEVSAEPTAGFSVTGGSLSVCGVSFSDYVGNALFLVDGDGALFQVRHRDEAIIVGVLRAADELEVPREARIPHPAELPVFHAHLDPIVVGSAVPAAEGVQPHRDAAVAVLRHG